MSDFLEELTMHVADSQVLKYALGHEGEAEVVNEYSVAAALGMIDSLGESARRMLEIGIVQDELIELGFELDGLSRLYYMLNKPLVIEESYIIGLEIYFNETGVLFKTTADVFLFSSPTWQDDLIAKVKELIKSAQPLD